MPRLPGPYDLGGVSFSTRAGIPSGDAGGSAIAGAAVRFGNTLQQIGFDRMREDAVMEGAAADGGALKELSDFERGFDQDGDYGTYQARFEKGANAIRDKYAARITSPRAREEWSADFDKTVLSSRNRVLNLGQTRTREAKLVGAKSGLEGFQSIIADPDAADDVRAKAKSDAEGSIAALQRNGLLSPSEADDWREKIVRGGEFVLGQRQIERDPTIISGKLPANVSDRAGMAMGYFQRQGYTKEQAAGIVGNLLAESSLNTGARNPGDGTDGTDSIGIGQWNSGRARALKAFAAANRADWRDFNVQLAFVDHELKTSESAAGNALRNAKTIDEATAAIAGYERPQGWSAANPRGAHNYKGRLKFAAQAAGETVRPEWYDNASPQDQLKFERQAESRQNELRAEQRGQIEVVTQNAPIAIQNTGAYDQPLPTRQQFVDAYGPQDGGQRYDAFNAAIETSTAAYDMRTMPADQVRSVVESARPQSSGNDAALETERYQSLSNAANATLKAREADPAAYVQQVYPAVSRAWESAASGDGSYQSAIATSVAAQQQLGITNVQPLPVPVATQAVEGFKDQQSPQADRLASVSSILMATDDPSQRRAIFEQMVEAGLPEQAQGVLLALERGDQAAADRLFLAATINPADLPGKIDATPAEIDQNVQDAIMADGKIGDIYYGLSDGSSEDFVPAMRDNKLLVNAVNLRMRAGEKMDAAIAGAAKDLYGDVQPVDAPNARILIPADADPDEELSRLDSMMPAVRSMVEQFVPMPEMAGSSRAIVEAARQNEIDAIMARGYFRNSGNDYVFVDPITGAIPDENGEPILFGAGMTAGNMDLQTGGGQAQPEALPQLDREQSLDNFLNPVETMR